MLAGGTNVQVERLSPEDPQLGGRFGNGEWYTDNGQCLGVQDKPEFFASTAQKGHILKRKPAFSNDLGEESKTKQNKYAIVCVLSVEKQCPGGVTSSGDETAAIS
ncbi:hypothetical protein T265_11699 [Opisthorchis viverrini]|uniref:Uncharacterized protein n=1 Tax=Opisthorchis viverrini TaxID=6198 RepID=A0A074Z8L0_OPIVI|nr:hypothetical protein T265_11699 [Opisthorchis viverrini]KER19565.1 hypothetical protein T265_11699 [Opisthorchis viverrini]